MRTTVNLDLKDLREILAFVLGIPVQDITQSRYSLGVIGMDADEIERRILEARALLTAERQGT